jgi:hypothetical protein
MANPFPRSQKIQPRVEPIKGSNAAGPVPGNRDIAEDPGQQNRGIADAEGRRLDRSAHHAGTASSSVVGGAPIRNKVTQGKY